MAALGMPPTAATETVTVTLPRQQLVALCEILGTLERKAERGDWWAARMRNLGGLPNTLRNAAIR